MDSSRAGQLDFVALLTFRYLDDLKVGCVGALIYSSLQERCELTDARTGIAVKFTTLIPMRYNDGSEVPLGQMNRIIDELALQFSGCSDEGVTKGQWLDPKDS